MSNDRAFHGSVKQQFRRFFFQPIQILGFSSGLMQIAARLRKNNGAIILMYHSVANTTQAEWIDPRNHVRAEIFEKQIIFLSQNRKVVAFDELISALRTGKPFAPGTVVITFDDGYIDNLSVAAPILEHYRMPATLFLPTGYIDRGETQWVDQVYTTFKYKTRHRLKWGTNPERVFELCSPKQTAACYQNVCMALLMANPEKRRVLLDDLYTQLSPTMRPPRLTMNWVDVRNLLANYKRFQIGGHTLEHTDLTCTSRENAQSELTACSQRIQKEVGIRPRYFSFCYGRTSEPLRRLVAEARFEAACGGGDIDPVVTIAADLFRLPRVAAQNSMRRFDLSTSAANTGIWRKLGR
jgi:peptidoglycan/xylan/chitin deacetylase (PgdA/CDA1 family)